MRHPRRLSRTARALVACLLLVACATRALALQTSVGGSEPAPGTGTASPTTPKAPPAPAVPAATPAGGGGASSPSAPAPNGPASAPPRLPATPIFDAVDPTAWELWWAFHRSVFVDARVSTRADDASMLATGEATFAPATHAAGLHCAPVLLDIAQNDRNPELVAATALALARLELGDGDLAREVDPRIDAALVKLLAHTQLQVAESAALALGVRARHEGAVVLASVLRDDADGRRAVARVQVPERVRAFAAYGLGLCADRTPSEDVRRFVAHVVHGVLDAPFAPSRDVQSACVNALGLVRLSGGDDLVRSPGRAGTLLDAAVKLPASAGPAALAAHLFLVVHDVERPMPVRAHALVAIGRVAARDDGALRAETVARIVALHASTDVHGDLRTSAVLALGALARPLDTPHDRDALAALDVAARDGERVSRGFALLGIGAAAGRGDLLEDLAPALALQRQLVARLADARSGAESWAALALGLAAHGSPRLRSGEIDRVLETFGKDAASASAATAASLALGLRGSTRAVAWMEDLALELRDDAPRSRATLALGLTRSRDGLAALRQIADDSLLRRSVLRDASAGLALCGDVSVADRICESAERATAGGAHVALAAALAEVGAPRHAQRCAKLAGDRTLQNAARIAWVRALGAACDPHPRPWFTPYAAGANYLAICETLTSSSGSGVLDLGG